VILMLIVVVLTVSSSAMLRESAVLIMVDRNPWLNFFSHAVLILGVAIVVAFPLYLALVASTHTASEIVQAPMPLLPGAYLWENYRKPLVGLGKLGSNTNGRADDVGELCRGHDHHRGQDRDLAAVRPLPSSTSASRSRCWVWAIFVTLMLPVECAFCPPTRLWPNWACSTATPVCPCR
jgi:sn-glycerol 3-phosphate transport system permease protein